MKGIEYAIFFNEQLDIVASLIYYCADNHRLEFDDYD